MESQPKEKIYNDENYGTREKEKLSKRKTLRGGWS